MAISDGTEMERVVGATDVFEGVAGSEGRRLALFDRPTIAKLVDVEAAISGRFQSVQGLSSRHACRGGDLGQRHGGLAERRQHTIHRRGISGARRFNMRNLDACRRLYDSLVSGPIDTKNAVMDVPYHPSAVCHAETPARLLHGTSLAAATAERHEALFKAFVYSGFPALEFGL